MAFQRLATDVFEIERKAEISFCGVVVVVVAMSAAAAVIGFFNCSNQLTSIRWNCFRKYAQYGVF